MKILIVGDIPPYPNIMGNQKFLTSHIQFLISMGHSVTYLYINRHFKGEKSSKLNFDIKDLYDVQVLEYHIPIIPNIAIKLKKRFYTKFYNGKSKTDSYYPNGLERYINHLHNRENFDACFVNYYYTTKLLTKIKIPIKGFYTHDSFINRGLINNCVSPSLSPNEEAKALQRAPIIFALQDTEASLFKKLAPKSQVKTIYMPLTYHSTPITNKHNLLFFGGKADFNVEGIEWFINNIWPKIKLRYNDARLIIGGSICDVLGNFGKYKGVTLYGRVDDAYDFYSLGDISINPVYHGSGLKIKTLEGIEYNKVVIASSHSTEGIFRISDSPIIIANDLTEWLSSIESLWDNSDRIQKLLSMSKEYIVSMNQYIKEQYETIFSYPNKSSYAESNSYCL